MGVFYEYIDSAQLQGAERTVIEQEGTTRTITLHRIVTDLVAPYFLQDLSGEDLEDLSNVNITNPANSQVLTILNGQWVNGYVGVADINDILNVVITDVQSGDTLSYNGTNWVNVVLTTDIDSLSDVTLSLPLSDGQALTYSSQLEKWVNATPSSTISTLDDVTLDTQTLTSGHYLAWDGVSAWVNVAPVFTTINTSFGTLANGNVLYFNNGAWTNYSLSLSNLGDVSLVQPPTNNQVLRYSSTLSKWTNIDALVSGIQYGATDPPDPSAFEEGTLYIKYL